MEVNVSSSNMLSLTQQMSNLGSQPDIGTTRSEHSEPILTPLRTPVAATPYCSPTGYGIFGGNSVS